MTPAEAAVDFYKSAFPAFARHFAKNAHSLSMSHLRATNPDAWKEWTEGDDGVEAAPESELATSMDVFVSPDGKEIWAAAVGESRRAFIRLEMTAKRSAFFWSKSEVTATAHDEAEALNPIAEKAEKLTASGWTRYLVEDGELVEE